MRTTDLPFDPTIDECAAPDSGCIPEPAPDEPDEASLAPRRRRRSTAGDRPDRVSERLDGADGGPPGHRCGRRHRRRMHGQRLPGLVVAAAVVLLIAARSASRAAHRARRVLARRRQLRRRRRQPDRPAMRTRTSMSTPPSAATPMACSCSLASQLGRRRREQPIAQFSLHARARRRCPCPGTHGRAAISLTTARRGREPARLGAPRAGDGTAALVELARARRLHVRLRDRAGAIDGLVQSGYHDHAHARATCGRRASARRRRSRTTTEHRSRSTARAMPRHEARRRSSSSTRARARRHRCGSSSVAPARSSSARSARSGPDGAMNDPRRARRGGRTAFVLDRNGDKLRELLLRSNGVERTAAYLRKKLQRLRLHRDRRDHGGLRLARRHDAQPPLRKLLLRLPSRTIIPYISIDLTQYPNGYATLRARALCSARSRSARACIALEVYLHTAAVRPGGARRRHSAAPPIASALGEGAERRRRDQRPRDQRDRYLDALEALSAVPLPRSAEARPHVDHAPGQRDPSRQQRLRHSAASAATSSTSRDMAPPRAYTYDALISRCDSGPALQ